VVELVDTPVLGTGAARRGGSSPLIRTKVTIDASLASTKQATGLFCLSSAPFIMKKPLHLIYIPGLGDDNPTGQERAVRLWPKWGVHSELFQMNWGDGKAWEPKFQRLLDRIDNLNAANNDIALIGASAGATAVINAYAARIDKIVGCVIIAGKVNHPERIGQQIRQKNPAFETSAFDCETALQTIDQIDRHKILSLYGIFDETVYKLDSRIPGARNRMAPVIGHFFIIASQISLGVPYFIRFLKRLQSSQS
jgi:hypothetical protein